MKNIFRNIALVLVASLSLYSCQQDTEIVNNVDSNSVPTIKYIRPTDTTVADQLLTSGAMGDMIAIIGEGLEGVRSIYFNDVAAELNPVLITPNSIICQIPAVMPTEITNTMTLITGKGVEVVYDFAVEIPKPFISSTSCEWAKVGTDMKLYGQYFFPLKEGDTPFIVTFPGGVVAEVKSYTENEIVVVVPECNLSGEITVEGEYGASLTKFKYRDDEGMFIDFEDISWDWWGYTTAYVKNDDQSLSGAYVEMVGSAADWNWNTSGLALYMADNINEDGSFVENLIPEGADPANYTFKFEARINSWSDLDMSMWFSGAYNTFTTDGEEGQFHWSGFKDGTPKGEWVTISVPMTSFNTNKEESVTDRVVTAADMGSFSIFFFGACDDAANIGTPISIYMDNFRLVEN